MQTILRWLTVGVVLSVVIAGLVLVAVGWWPLSLPSGAPGHANQHPAEGPVAQAAEPVNPAPAAQPVAQAPRSTFHQNLLVIPECRLNILFKQEVPSQHDGQILYIATDLKPGDNVEQLRKEDRLVELTETYAYIDIQPSEQVPEADQVSVEVTDKDGKKEVRKCRRVRDTDKVVDSTKIHIVPRPRQLRRLKVGDEVAKDQLIALVDPMLAVDEYTSKRTAVDAAKADWEASIRTRDEALERYKTLNNLYNVPVGRVVSLEDLRGAKLTYDRYFFEEIGKKEAITKSEAELNQAMTVLKMHEIRAKISGMIRAIVKNEGEALKAGEQVLLLHHQDKIQVEGRVEWQHVARLHKDDKVVIEPYTPRAPRRVLSGHLDQVKGVAVSKDLAVVSASVDRTVRVWDHKTGDELALFQHPEAVNAVACSPGADKDNDLCLSGGLDGVGRLWDLKKGSDQAPVELKGGHRGPINCVAFSPNGKWCVTGGEDHVICVWSTDGQLVHSLTDGHIAGVTSVQFLSELQLVSAGKEPQLVLWTLSADGSPAGSPRVFSNRTGEVAALGVNPNTHQALLDQGRELRLLSLPAGRVEGGLQNMSGTLNFSTMALFSPDGNLILTNSNENRVQLWRAPTKETRAYELRHLVWGGGNVTCGAFAPLDTDNPDDAFAVTGTEDQQVILWELPTKKEVQEQLVGRISLVEPAVDDSSRMVRVWAEIGNKDRRLIQGLTATMAVYPEAAKK